MNTTPFFPKDIWKCTWNENWKIFFIDDKTLIRKLKKSFRNTWSRLGPTTILDHSVGYWQEQVLLVSSFLVLWMRLNPNGYFICFFDPSKRRDPECEINMTVEHCRQILWLNSFWWADFGAHLMSSLSCFQLWGINLEENKY